MSRLILVSVGKVGGVEAFAPMDLEDVKAIGDAKTLVCEVKGDRSKRTALQNRAIHKFCDLLATALNDAGWDMKKTLSKQADIPWHQMTVKQFLWRPIQVAMLNKSSTAGLEVDEVAKVYETLNRHTASKLGVSVIFPSKNQTIEDSK